MVQRDACDVFISGVGAWTPFGVGWPAVQAALVEGRAAFGPVGEGFGPDPRLYAGDPVRISGFVLPIEGEEPHLARLLVRFCLVDAVPVGLPVRWPTDQPRPRPDQWLRLEGVLVSETIGGRQRSAVKASRVVPIPRPRQPLEP